jgi:DNA-binding Lrp family transcriptional regulator
MVLAFVCIKIGSGEQQILHRAVLEEVKKISGVLEVHLVFGCYDAMAKVEAKDTDRLSTLVVDRIGSISSVLWTETFVTHP